MESTQKVTAIITTFNRSAYCAEAIKSVLGQDYPHFELLVLDNSSHDDTEAVVKGFNDERIKFIRHEPMNIAKARNLGWKSASTNYVAFLDDDDRWLPNKLRAEIEAFNRSEESVALTYGGFHMVKDGVHIDTHEAILAGNILKEIIAQKDAFTGSASNPMIRKDVIEALGGYDERVVTGEDWELYMRLAAKYGVAKTDEIVVEIRQHAGPRLGDKLKEAGELELFVMNQYPEIFAADKRLTSFYYQKVGGKYCRIGESQKGRGFLQKSLVANPFNLKAYVQYLLSFVPVEWYRRVHALYITHAKGM